MDNVTHTLIGIAAGEAVSVYRKKARVPLWIASGIAGNLPDLDVLATTFVFPGKLAYLLHHRGHTHTLLATPFLLMLAFLPLYWLWRKNAEMPWKEIFFLLLVGTPLHLLADYWNSYGIHPFWPFRNDWIYGDMIFIVEPWIWALLLPMIFFSAATKTAKAACVILSAVIVGLGWYHEFVATGAALALTLATIFFYAAHWRIPSREKRLGVAVICLFSFLLAMFETKEALSKKYARAGHELLLQPFPANPFCWTTIEATLDARGYRATLATVAPFPTLFSAENCPAILEGSTTAQLERPLLSPSREKIELGTYFSSRETFDEISQNCHMRAFLRFARFPFWREAKEGWVVGDLRFDRDETLSFGEFLIPKSNENCPRDLPPWEGKFFPKNSP